MKRNYKPFRVLSIDWDYLVDADLNTRLKCFPDANENLNWSIQNIIWANRYVDNNGLAEVTVDQSAYDFLISYAREHSQPDTFIAARDSHKDLYGIIKDLKLKSIPLEVINLDFHHDCYGSSDDQNEVDCENWVLKTFEGSERLVRSKHNTYNWVRRPTSDQKEVDADWFSSTTDIYSLNNDTTAFDVIFICKSSCWCPPHLDKQFNQFMESIKEYSQFTSTACSKLKDRYDDKFKYVMEKTAEARSVVLDNIQI